MSNEVKVKEIPFENVMILPPKPGVCRECAVNHRPDQPHNRDSLYYQMKFRQKHGRFPTWWDAMAHCEKHIQKIWIDALAERGVIVELPEETAVENLNNGWIHRESRLPAETDGDSTGKVFAWHAYQGAMLTPWSDFNKNSFNVYWMRVSDGASAPWIAAVERLPTKEDSDALNCVLAKDMHNGISVTGFHQFGWNSALTHWQRLPAPPSDYKELRRMK